LEKPVNKYRNKRMRTCRSCLVILLILFAGSLFSQINLGDDLEIDYAKPKKYEIAGITVSGVKYLDNNALIMISGLSIGDKGYLILFIFILYEFR